MKLVNYLGLVILAFVLFSCSNYPPLEVVKSVDLEKYSGKWYEIVRFPHSFEKDCYCVTAEYIRTNEDYIKVINSCRKGSIKGKPNKAEGKAFVIENSNNAKLEVQFFWPFRGDYWIIDLADDYSWVVVGHPSREYLWILSRTPKLDNDLTAELIEKIRTKGFDTSKIIFTEQMCE